MNPNFERDLSRQMQKTFDKLFESYAGQPVDVVQAALKREGFSSDGSSDFSTLAKAISSGTRISVA